VIPFISVVLCATPFTRAGFEDVIGSFDGIFYLLDNFMSFGHVLAGFSDFGLNTSPEATNSQPDYLKTMKSQISSTSNVILAGFRVFKNF
jgi:hypothetical protein